MGNSIARDMRGRRDQTVTSGEEAPRHGRGFDSQDGL